MFSSIFSIVPVPPACRFLRIRQWFKWYSGIPADLRKDSVPLKLEKLKFENVRNDIWRIEELKTWRMKTEEVKTNLWQLHRKSFNNTELSMLSSSFSFLFLLILDFLNLCRFSVCQCCICPLLWDSNFNVQILFSKLKFEDSSKSKNKELEIERLDKLDTWRNWQGSQIEEMKIDKMPPVFGWGLTLWGSNGNRF